MNDFPPGPPGSGRRTRAATVVTVMAASGALVTLTIVGRWSGNAPGPLLAVDIVTGVLGWLFTPLMLWRPVAGTALLTVLAAVSPAVTPPATMGALQVARRRDRPVAVAVSAAGIAAHAVQGVWRSHGGMSYGWWLALVTVAYGALLGWGAWARAREALICSLRERAHRAEQEQERRVAEARMLERRRIAREMHDVLAHRLSLLATFAGAIEYRPDSSPEQLSRAAGVVRGSVHQALEELREVISLLRDDGSPEADGVHPQPVLADLPRLIEESRGAGTTVELHETVAEPSEAPPAVARTAYRVVQEGLTNARKHAAGRPVRVHLRGGPGVGLVVEVRNLLGHAGGTGHADHSDRAGLGGAGLVGLTERVRLAGGHLDHREADGEFRLRASIPWAV